VKKKGGAAIQPRRPDFFGRSSARRGASAKSVELGSYSWLEAVLLSDSLFGCALITTGTARRCDGASQKFGSVAAGLIALRAIAAAGVAAAT
jgi:hypothetical protein